MFKKGDKVIANQNWNDITKGREYTVTAVDGSLVWIEDDSGFQDGYYYHRFDGKPTTTTPESQLSPQNLTVLRHQKRTGSITQREALMDHSVQSLTKRISELRQAGYKIIKEQKRHPITGQRYARYEFAQQAA